MFISKSRPIQMLFCVTSFPFCLSSLTYFISRLSLIFYASNFHCFFYLFIFFNHPLDFCLCMLFQMVSSFIFLSVIYLSRHVLMPVLFTLSTSTVSTSKLTRIFQSGKFDADHTDKLDPAAAGQSIAKQTPGLDTNPDTTTKISS